MSHIVDTILRAIEYICENQNEYTVPLKSGLKKLTTKIPPEKRTLKNLPRDSRGKSRVRFQDWLGLKKTRPSNHSVGQAYDGAWYGWSHRAIRGFRVGDVIKPGDIGNKFQHSSKVEKKYRELLRRGTKEADKYIDSIKFKPYRIKTEKEAFEHAERFAKNVS